MTNPFVIKVPDGATEIDLGPLLKPLLWALKENLAIHEGLPRSYGERKKVDQCAPDELEEVMRWAQDSYRYNELIRRLTRPTLVAYLEANGWVDEDGRGYCYIRDYMAKKPSWERRSGDALHLHCPSDGLKLFVAKDVVSTLAYKHAKTKLEMIEEILSYTNILDLIVQELK